MANNFLDYEGLKHYNSKLQEQLTEKIDKVDGKSLSTNDFTDADKAKLDSIKADASKVAVTVKQKSGTEIATITIDGAASKLYVPTISEATSSASGLMTADDKAKLDGFNDADTYALKSDITSMYKYKGSVANEAALPESDNTVGDVYNTEDTGMNYGWTGTNWDSLGAVFSVTNITNAEIDAMFA
ncbi:MAG: hypothetical protein NC247_04890 [Ruminococcus flavefaciens]|nr:hypothetical protein [Ruminococcus flavefaciens]MCM1361050.1 hypothetical protein [Clostridiales bacterium]